MKRHSHLFLLFAGFFVLLSSCTRNDLHEQPTETPVVKVANEWLTSRVKEGETVRNERIESLRQSILPAQSSTEILEDGEKLIIVPIASNFKMNTNSDKNADHYLLLFENKAKQVYKGNIVQFVPENSQQRSLPKNTLSRLWNCENVNANGTFTVLTIFDKHLYASTFKDGKKTAYTTMEAKKNDLNDAVVNVPGELRCIEHYLVTTHYYSDGTTQVFEEYIGTSCYRWCVPGEACAVKEDDGLGGGGNPDEEVEASRTLVWHVYNPTGPLNDTAHGYGINSIETVKFKKNSSAPQGGFFTKIHHNTSDCNIWNASYLEDENKVSAIEQTATSSVKGHYFLRGERTGINNSRSWQLSDVK